jgi:hypothetical protein
MTMGYDAQRADWLLEFGGPQRLERPSRRGSELVQDASVAGMPPSPTRIA